MTFCVQRIKNTILVKSTKYVIIFDNSLCMLMLFICCLMVVL